MFFSNQSRRRNTLLMKLITFDKYVDEISTILPNHFIVEQFHDFYFQIAQKIYAPVEEEIIQEYFENIIQFSKFLRLFKRLQDEIKLLEKNRKIRSRVRNYYIELFLKKKTLIYSTEFQRTVDLTLNSLIMKEMEQELYNIQRMNSSPTRKYQNELPILFESDENISQ